MPKTPTILMVLFCLAACSEPTIQVTFDIPDIYKSGENQQCMANCDLLFDQCYPPGPDEEECRQIFEDCLSGCEQQEPECEQACQEDQHRCLEGQGNQEGQEQCELLRGECRDTCREGIVEWSYLQVFKPFPTSQNEDPFGCEELEFSEVTPEILRASLIQDVVVYAGQSGEPLVGIDRKGLKVFLAQAFDSGDKPVVADCEEIGDINDDVHVRLVGEPAAVVTLYMQEYQDWVFGAQELPDPIELLATDVFNTPLQDREVHWNIVGPAGKGSDGHDNTDGEGQLVFSPQTPTVSGPVILEIVARWQRDPTPLIKAFRQPAVLDGPLPESKVLDIQIGRIGPSGQMGYAGTTYCGMPISTCLFYGHYGNGRMNWQQLTLAELEGQEPAALGIIPGTGRDRVIVLGREKWLELDPLSNNMIERSFESYFSEPIWVLPIGSCSPTAPAEMLVAFADGSSGVYGADGGNRLANHTFSSLQVWGHGYFSGCVADQEGNQHRTLIGEQEDSYWRVFAEINDRLVQFDWVAQLRGVGFSPRTDSQPGYLLVGRLGQDSPEIVRLRLLHQPTIGPVRLGEVSSVPLFSVPEAIGAGDMDADNILDMVGLFPLENSERFAHALLGHTHKGKPVSGMLSVGFSQQPARLWLADFDGDGTDDMAVMRELDCQPAENEQCLQQCENEYRICLEGQEPHQCEELFLECNRICEDEMRCFQYMDIYLMGS